MPDALHPDSRRPLTSKEKIQKTLRLPDTQAIDALTAMIESDRSELKPPYGLAACPLVFAILTYHFTFTFFSPPLAAITFTLSIITGLVVGAISSGRKRERLLREQAAISALLQVLTPVAAWEDAKVGRERKQTLLDLFFSVTVRGAKNELAAPILQVAAREGEKSDLFRIYPLTQSFAASPKQQAVRDAARACFAAIEARTDYGTIADIPEYLKLGIAPPGEDGAITEAILLRRQALTRLLPQLTPEDAVLLAPRQYKFLYNLLQGGQSGYPNGLLIAIVAMAQRLEDTTALNAVRRCAQMDAPTEEERALRRAARNALRVLREKAEREKTGATLLRASSAPAGKETLLRAAQSKPSDRETQTLLRAASKNGPLPPKSEEGDRC